MLDAARESYKRYLLQTEGSRSPERLKVIHGWIIEELHSVLGDSYCIQGLTDRGGKESTVQGRYYPKKVDVEISRNGITLGVVSLKFPMVNYNQNKNNYFEHQLGETANLRSRDIVFGHIMLRTHPTPYLNKNKVFKKWEKVNDPAIELYAKLAEDHGLHHVPDIQCMVVFLLSEFRGEITRQCTRDDLPDVSEENYRLLEDKLSIDRFFERMKDEIHAKYSRTR